jgi:hypothetical protein
MDERTQETNSDVKEVTWEQWLAKQRDELSLLLGKLAVLSTRPTNKDWDETIIIWQKTLLETIIDPLWKSMRQLKEDNKQLRDTLEKREAEITDVLEKMGNWQKDFQLRLEKLERVQRKLIEYLRENQMHRKETSDERLARLNKFWMMS